MPKTTRRARNRTRIRDYITRVAFTLFDRHGYEAVTMEQIAAEADVARGTLYNHFPVKEAVLANGLHAELERDLAPLLEEMLSRESFASRLNMLLEASARWWEENRQYAAPYIRHRFQEVRDGHGTQTGSDMVSVYVHLIELAKEDGELDPNTPSTRLAHYLHFLYLSAVMAWLSDPGKSLGDEFGYVLDFFMKGAAVA